MYLRTYLNHPAKFKINMTILTCLNKRKELTVTDGRTLIIEKLPFLKMINSGNITYCPVFLFLFGLNLQSVVHTIILWFLQK